MDKPSAVRELLDPSRHPKSRAEYDVWINKYNECIRLLAEKCRSKVPRLSVGRRTSLVARIARLKSAKALLDRRFIHTIRVWDEIETAFKGRVVTAIVTNLSHIEPRQFLEDARNTVVENVRIILEKHKSLKVNTVFTGEFVAGDKREDKTINTKNCELYISSDLSEWYDKHVIESTISSLEEFQERDSGWALSRTVNLMINVNKYNPLRSGCYIELPSEIKLKRAVINVRSEDDACFAWSVVAALHPAEKNGGRMNQYPDYATKLNLQSIEFPMTLNQIGKFEKLNDISINVYSFEMNNKNAYTVFPVRLSSGEKDKHVDMLYVPDKQGGIGHFAWIKNLSRLVGSQLSRHKCKKYICKRCLHYFSTNEKLESHAINCIELNDCAIRLPKDDQKWLRFTNYSRKERVPFVIYADIECILEKIVRDNGEERTLQSYPYQQHRVFSIGYYICCSYDHSLSKYRFHRSANCISWFVKRLSRIARRVKKILSIEVPMTEMSEEEHKTYREATHCHVCQKPFEPNNSKVRDHCHLTGRYRGPAHSNCNLNHKNSYTIPIIFHNLSGYDAHFFITEIANAFKGDINVLPITKEKYISFTKTVQDKNDTPDKCIKLRFIDSFKFLNSSLDKLASFLNRDKLKVLHSQYPNLPTEKFDLLVRKGVFPYEYLDSPDKLQDRCLPSRGMFYSSVTGDTVSESDYAHALNVWQSFGIETLGEYSDLYLKIDVLLLSDIFENFRDSCIRSYGLDPAHYFTLPGFTWDAMLKHTNITFELLTDIDMVLFIERGIRGGLSQCSSRYARADNKYMQSYDPAKPSTYLMYYDVNNLYGWAMCQPLPYAKFKWVDDVSQFDVSSIAADSPTGYIIEVDLEYPQHLHDLHADLPFCPKRDKPLGKRSTKLLATLYDKERYVMHYRNLQQCTRHGLRITKIHRILQFDQAPWLRGYIELNTRFRTQATNDFEKNLYKLMNNAVYGKTMENVRNRVNVKLVTKWEGRYGAEALLSKPNFHSRSIFSENLMAIELRNIEVKFNKPIYVGMCILDISKTCLYDFHYEFIKPLYKDKCKIMYTDTDSLIYYFESDDIYEVMKDNIAKFDTSDYPMNNAYGIPLVNKKVPGLMKDENNGMIMHEFVGLRSKMYSFKVYGKEDEKKLKGVKSNVVARTITFDDYTTSLNESKEIVRRQSCITSKMHKVLTISQAKIALSPYDDKRYILPGSTETLPWGHYRIPTENT